jgi:protein-tyrosine phosphatase
VQERHIRLAGTRNLRDVGGYPAGAGRQTRWRTLFRADALDQVPVESQAVLTQLGLRQAIDMRWPIEVETRPSVFRSSPTVRYVNLPLRDSGTATISGFPVAYRDMIDDSGVQLANVARALLDPDGLPAVVGCAAGVDRTGLAIAIVLTAVGVPADVVAADYALSAATYASDEGSGLDDWRSGPIAIDCRPEYMIGTLDHLRRRHGGVAAFLASHGLTDADIRRLGALLTEPIPSRSVSPARASSGRPRPAAPGGSALRALPRR